MKCEDALSGVVETKGNYGVALLDRLTKSAVGIPTAETELKPKELKENFESALYELLVLRSKLLKKSTELQAKCRDEERVFRSTIERLRNDLGELSQQFTKLDTEVHMVSGKLVHLGDQLERKNLPRKRIEEARDLILEFYKFLGAGGGSVATAITSQSDESQLIEAATRLKNLTSLCLELPDDERFLAAKQRVTVANQSLEASLLDRFRHNYATINIEVMKKIADILVNSKSYAQCAEILIEETLKFINPNRFDFKNITKRLVSAEKHIMAIFLRPDSVIMQLIHGLFNTKLKVYLTNRIRQDSNVQTFLTNLYTEYRNVDRLINELSSELTLVTDPMQLSKLFRELFNDYLTGYMKRENEWLASRLASHLSQFYESRNHQKRVLNTSGLADLRRDLQAKLHISPGERDLNDYEESLLSEEVAVNIIEDVRASAKRCLLLSQSNTLADNGKLIFSYLYQYLIVEHVDYGVTLSLQGLQVTDPRSADPHLVYFTVIHDATSIFHFFEKTIDESILTLVSSSPTHVREITAKRQSVKQDLESKFATGLDRCLNLAISRVHYVLSSEQRKTDFRTDATTPGFNPGGPPSVACQHVVNFLNKVVRDTKTHLDGQNLKNFVHELGTRLNRTLVDHFYGFTYSDTGGFVAMQDVTAYREVAKQLGDPIIDRLFDVLLKLMNLMLIKPENVPQVMQDYLQSGIPKDLLMNFIQLRIDYKSIRLQDLVFPKSTR